MKTTVLEVAKLIQGFNHLLAYHQQVFWVQVLCYIPGEAALVHPRLGSGQKRREIDLYINSYNTTWQLLYVDHGTFYGIWDPCEEGFTQEMALTIKRMPLKDWVCQNYANNVCEAVTPFKKSSNIKHNEIRVIFPYFNMYIKLSYLIRSREIKRKRLNISNILLLLRICVYIYREEKMFIPITNEGSRKILRKNFDMKNCQFFIDECMTPKGQII